MSSPRPSSSIRAGDADRDRAVELLNEHFAAGRLTTREREERTAKALTARTLSELEALLADLPLSSPSATTRRVRRVRPHPAPAVLLAAVVVLLGLHVVPVFAVVAVVFLVTRVAFGCHGGHWAHGRRG